MAEGGSAAEADADAVHQGAGEGFVAEEADPGAEAGAAGVGAERDGRPAVVGGGPLEDDRAAVVELTRRPAIRRSSSAASDGGLDGRRADWEKVWTARPPA